MGLLCWQYAGSRKILSNPDVDMLFYANDVLFVLGPPDRIANIAGLSQNQEEGDAS